MKLARYRAIPFEFRVLYTFLKMPIAMTDSAWFQPASDQSLLVYFGQQITLEANQRVRKLLCLLESEPVAGIRNLHPAYSSLLINFDALKLSHSELEIILRGYLDRLEAVRLPEPRRREIPACYGGEFGPDLNEVAALHGMTPAQAIELHASVTYVVYFLGFVPGFAYLGELPDALATPRLATPRRRAAPGSVGIAGKQTGRVPVCYARRLEIDRAHSYRDVSPGPKRHELSVHRRPRAFYTDFQRAIQGAGEGVSVIQVQTPGLLTTVQDLGREGFGPIGVSPSGAGDPISLRVGNGLVGNAERAAGLEMTLLGGTFLFPEGAILALAGSDFGATLDGATVDLWTPVEVQPGATLRVGPTRSGARCYLCVQGGIDVTPFLGSASTHILSGLGGFEGRPLRKGDVLHIGRDDQAFPQKNHRSAGIGFFVGLVRSCASHLVRRLLGFPSHRCARSVRASIASASNPIAWVCGWKGHLCHSVLIER